MDLEKVMGEYRTRVRMFVGLIVVVLGILGLRLAQLQLLDFEEYAGESRSNAVRERRVIPARGVISDRNNILMVDNEPSYTVTITPRVFNAANVRALADLLEVPDSLVAAKIREARRRSSYQPFKAFREVPFDVVSRLTEKLYELPGVSYEEEFRRRYHTEAMASHALGYIREITERELAGLRGREYRQRDLIGKSGLEKNYEGYLRGRPGAELKLVNVHGLEVSSYRDGVYDDEPVGGYNLRLGIDAGVQALAESLFVNKRGAAVALNPKSGEILTLVSKPDFDPQTFSESVSPEKWEYLTASEDKPMFNRATMSGMPPGSTWKPFMALVGLQEGVITPTSIYRDVGGYRLGRRVFRNHAGVAYGPIDVTDALRVSSNAFFFHVMMQLDVDTFKEWATRFGFGVPIPMDIGEQKPGLIPDSAYYNRTYPRGWTAGYTINLGIGQGNMAVTPMQLARYAAALANGGILVPPHLVRELVHPETGELLRPALPEPEKIPIEEKYFDVVRKGMRLVMEAGTGRYVQIPGIASGGKTGTSQNPHGKDHSVFIMFAPWDDPEIAVAVVVENAGYGASVAGPIASLMVERYLTGEIADTPERRRILNRALNAASAE